jgi:hypothetical protein
MSSDEQLYGFPKTQVRVNPERREVKREFYQTRNEVARNPFTLVLYRPPDHQKQSQHNNNNLAAYVVLPGFKFKFNSF